MTPLTEKNVALPLLAAALTAALLLAGCDFGIKSGKPERTPLQTQILRVEVDPNPVVAGDTATFTCVIADSTDERFEFRWFLDAPTRVTESNQTDWVAEVDTGEHRFRVEADNGSTDSTSVNRGFTVEVVE
jgi:hypothetical protein